MYKTSSSEVGGSSIPDFKYQKAIKQIGKLVNINTALKKEALSLQERYDSLRTDYENLRDCYEQLEAEAQPRSSLPDLETIGVQTESNQQLCENDTYSDVMEKREKQEDMQRRLTEKDHVIESLEIALETKNEENRYARLECQKLEEQLRLLRQQTDNSNSALFEAENQKLKEQLFKSEQWANQLRQNLEEIRKQSFLSDIRKQKNSTSSIELAEGNTLHKVKQLERDNELLKKREEEKIKKYKREIESLRREKQERDRTVLELRAFMKKQQIYIQKFATQPK